MDFELPNILVNHYRVVGLLSFFINWFAMISIILKSGKMNNFRYYLMYFQISCIMVDIQLTCFMQPIPLFPLIAGYSNGILSTYFNVPSHVLMCITFLFINIQIHSLTICFIKKHQAITCIGSKYVLSYTKTRIIFGIFYGWPFLVAGCFYFCDVGREEQLRLIEKRDPTLLPGFQNLREFQYYELSGLCTIAFTLITFGYTLAITIIPPLAWHMFYLLNRNRLRMSNVFIARHKSIVKSLVAQFLTCPITLIPNLGVMVSLALELSYAQKLGTYFLMVMTLHSMINSIVMILSYPDFKNCVFSCFRFERSVAVFSVNRVTITE